MTTSDNTFPNRLTKIDALTLPDHSFLTATDDCYFLGEYTARGGFSYSATNDLISNFKKSMDRREHPSEWRYKGLAIAKAAGAFRSALGDSGLDLLTFVPVPPSKAKEDPSYDDRMERMIREIRPEKPVDLRELVIQPASTEADHELPEGEQRLRPEERESLYLIDETLAQPLMNQIAVVDDMLTTGAHFKAAKSLLSKRFPGVTIIGLFIARRAPNTELSDF